MAFRGRRGRRGTNAKKVVYDNITFDSLDEGRRYKILKLRLRAGEIQDLQCHVTFLLQESFKLRKRTIRKMEYTPDFTYMIGDQKYAEDFKGRVSEYYKLKVKMFLRLYGDQYIFIESKRRGEGFTEKTY